MVSDTRFVHGAERLAQRIRTIRTRLSLPPMIDDIGQLLLDRTLRRFDAQVDPDGNPWPALSPRTIKNRSYHGAESNRMLNVTGTMRDSIRLLRGSNASATYTNTGAGVRIGVNGGKQGVKARVHNFGHGAIPARRFLGIGALDVKAVDSFLRRRAQKALDES